MRRTDRIVNEPAILFDTTGIRDDPRHWDSRAAEVAAHATGAMRMSGFSWLSNSPLPLVAASLLLAVALLATIVSAGSSSISRADLSEALAPADDIGRAIVLPEAPPPIAALLFGERGGL